MEILLKFKKYFPISIFFLAICNAARPDKGRVLIEKMKCSWGAPNSDFLFCTPALAVGSLITMLGKL